MRARAVGEVAMSSRASENWRLHSCRCGNENLTSEVASHKLKMSDKWHPMRVRAVGEVAMSRSSDRQQTNCTAAGAENVPQTRLEAYLCGSRKCTSIVQFNSTMLQVWKRIPN